MAAPAGRAEGGPALTMRLSTLSFLLLALSQRQEPVFRAGWPACGSVDTRWAKPTAPSSANAASSLL